MENNLKSILEVLKSNILGEYLCSITNQHHADVIDRILNSDNILDYNDNFKILLEICDKRREYEIYNDIKEIYEYAHSKFVLENWGKSDKDKWYYNHYYRYFIDVVMKEIPERKSIMNDIKSLYNVFEEDPFDDWEYVNSFMVQLSDNIREKLKGKDKKDSVKPLLEDFKKDNTMLTDCMFTKDFIFGDDGKKYDILKEAYTRMAEMIAYVYCRGNITDDIKRGCEMLGKMFASNMVFPKPKLDDILKNPMYHKDYTIK